MTSIWYCLGLLFGHGRTWGLAPTCFNQQNWNHAEAIVVVRLKQQKWGLLLLVWCGYTWWTVGIKWWGPDMWDNDGQQSIGIFQETGFLYIYICFPIPTKVAIYSQLQNILGMSLSMWLRHRIFPPDLCCSFPMMCFWFNCPQYCCWLNPGFVSRLVIILLIPRGWNHLFWCKHPGFCRASCP